MDDAPGLRLSILGIVVISLFGALFARLWYLQVMTTEDYEQVTQANSVRTITEEAPRGRILDAQGRVLVDNRTSLVVTIDTEELDELDEAAEDELLLDLAGELTDFGVPTKVERIERRLEDPQYSPLQPIPVAVDVPEELGIYLAENADAYPGVAVERESVRTYPHGTLAAHIVGYVGRISPEEFEEKMGPIEEPRDDVAKPYQPDSNIGKTGVEQVYEDDLRGVPGITRVEIDAQGRVVREIASQAPVPGNDLQLTVDLDVQANAETQLATQLEGLRGSRTTDNKTRETPAGAAVVLDPRNGAVIAMASYPTYDPSEFVNGISQERFDRLTQVDPSENPLTDRAIGGLYAPGSTFKLVTAHAGLASGMIEGSTTLNDPGYYDIIGCEGGPDVCQRQNAGRQVNGIVDVPTSLTVSSDVYYYWLGDRFYRESATFGEGIQASARAFGFDEPTGIPLPGESGGVIPDPAWKAELAAAIDGDPTWYAGDNLNLAIGQGDVLVTPLQIADAYATFANGGTRYQPQVAARVLRPGADPADPASVVRIVEPVVNGTVDLAPRIADPIRQGLAGVTVSGTAAAAFDGWDHEGVPAAGQDGHGRGGQRHRHPGRQRPVRRRGADRRAPLRSVRHPRGGRVRLRRRRPGGPAHPRAAGLRRPRRPAGRGRSPARPRRSERLMSLAELARVTRPGPDTSRRDPSAPFRHVDVALVVSTLALAGIGVLMVFSATKGAEGPVDTTYLLRQGAFVVGGALLMAGLSLLDYRKLQDWAPFIYLGSIALLVAVLSPLGSESKGAQAWFGFGPFQLQPAEFAKLALAVGLGALLAAWEGDIDLRRLAAALVVAGVPIGLILLQPDLGTVLVFVAMTMAMLLVGRGQGAPHPGADRGGRRRGGRRAQQQRPGRVPEGPPHRLHRSGGGQPGVHLQRPAVHRRGGQRRAQRRGPVRGRSDPARLRARAADRLHLHRGRRGAGLRRLGHRARALRGDPVADLARRPAGPGRLRAARVRGRAGHVRLPGLRERGHGHRHHAGDGHPAAVPVLRRVLGADVVPGRGHRQLHPHAAIPVGARLLGK